MVEQYKKRYENCKKDEYKINMTGGSADKQKQKYVKIDFQTGMFEAMKKNMVGWLDCKALRVFRF